MITLRAGIDTDGVDDHVQILEALDVGSIRLVGEFSGGRLVIPSNAQIFAHGAKYTLAAGTNDHGMINSDSISGNTDIALFGGEYDWNGDNNSAGFQGLRFDGVKGFIVEGVTFRNAPLHNVMSIGDEGVNADWLIADSESYDAGRQAPGGDAWRVATGFSEADLGGRLYRCIGNDSTHHGYHLGWNCVADRCYAEGNPSVNFYAAHGSNQQFIHVTGRTPGGHNLSIDTAAAEVRVFCPDLIGSGPTHSTLRIAGTNTRAYKGSATGGATNINTAGSTNALVVGVATT